MLACLTEGDAPTAVTGVLLPKLMVVPHSNQALEELFAGFRTRAFNWALLSDICVADVVTAVGAGVELINGVGYGV